MTWVTRPCNNGLNCYLACPEVWKCSAFDRPQGFWDKANFTGKMASRRDGFWGIEIPGFFCPAGTYGMYETQVLIYITTLSVGRSLKLYCRQSQLLYPDGITDFRQLQISIHSCTNSLDINLMSVYYIHFIMFLLWMVAPGLRLDDIYTCIRLFSFSYDLFLCSTGIHCYSNRRRLLLPATWCSPFQRW